MPKIKYREQHFRAETMELIVLANYVIAEYEAQGFTLTLRQLYYQFVARDIIANTQASYKRLGQIINDARLAGQIDWYAIEDRTRNLQGIPTWDTPASMVRACSQQFTLDRWADQKCRVEVWVEKDALAGVFAAVCAEYQLPLFPCRGYTSQSEMWVASQRLRRIVQSGQDVLILHFGDHDPSGLDMSRDIDDRLRLFGAAVGFRRLALNMGQVEEHGPPPNPAKATDSRFLDYQELYGDQSWELDALQPALLAELVRTSVRPLIDQDAWAASVRAERDQRRNLERVAEQWDDVIKRVI